MFSTNQAQTIFCCWGPNSSLVFRGPLDKNQIFLKNPGAPPSPSGLGDREQRPGAVRVNLQRGRPQRLPAPRAAGRGLRSLRWRFWSSPHWVPIQSDSPKRGWVGGWGWGQSQNGAFWSVLKGEPKGNRFLLVSYVGRETGSCTPSRWKAAMPGIKQVWPKSLVLGICEIKPGPIFYF